MKVVILAGWSWSRLWPVSTVEYPKQFVRLVWNHSLLQETRERMSPCCASAEEDIFVSTQAMYMPLIQEHLGEYITWAHTVQDAPGGSQRFFQTHIVCEPARRNTFPAFLYLARYLREFHACADDEVLVFCPSDHSIAPASRFHDYLHQAAQYAAQWDIILFGIVPDSPETGYGYIQVAEHTDLSVFAYPVTAFAEKPSLETAKKYLDAGNYFWNAGIFMLRYDTLLQETRRLLPETAPLLNLPFTEFEARFDELPALPIDVAIMEKTTRARVIPMHIQRSDIGSRDAVYAIMPKDDQWNVVIWSSLTAHNVTNSLIYSTSETPVIISDMDRALCIADPQWTYITTLGHSQTIKTLLPSDG